MKLQSLLGALEVAAHLVEVAPPLLRISRRTWSELR